MAALVGPNGAGKTTLLQLAVGLTQAERRRACACSAARRGDDAARAAPAHRVRRAGAPAATSGFTIAETLKLGRKLNPSWDDARRARAHRARSGCRSAQKVGKLSGGQQAQVALTLALAKRPELLLLDEPVASLDPLARREFLQPVMEAVAETGMTVVLSSHIVADLERVCDHLVILVGRRTSSSPGRSTRSSPATGCSPVRACDPAAVARVHQVIRASHTERQTTLLVRANGHVYDACWEVHEVDLEEIVLAYLGYGHARVREAVAG